MTIRSSELKTVQKVITSETSALNIGGQVPSSMKRWVTFLAADVKGVALGASNAVLYLASCDVSNPTKASVIATSSRKLCLPIKATQKSIFSKFLPVLIPPAGPDPDTPLFSIAGGKWLGAWASKTTMHVFMQYFDE